MWTILIALRYRYLTPVGAIDGSSRLNQQVATFWEVLSEAGHLADDHLMSYYIDLAGREPFTSLEKRPDTNLYHVVLGSPSIQFDSKWCLHAYQGLVVPNLRLQGGL